MPLFFSLDEPTLTTPLYTSYATSTTTRQEREGWGQRQRAVLRQGSLWRAQRVEQGGLFVQGACDLPVPPRQPLDVPPQALQDTHLQLGLRGEVTGFCSGPCHGGNSRWWRYNMVELQHAQGNDERQAMVSPTDGQQQHQHPKMVVGSGYTQGNDERQAITSQRQPYVRCTKCEGPSTSMAHFCAGHAKSKLSPSSVMQRRQNTHDNTTASLHTHARVDTHTCDKQQPPPPLSRSTHTYL